MSDLPSRREFLATGALLAAIPLFPEVLAAGEPATRLPEGSAPAPVSFPWFPSRVHAFIWRNWSLVPVVRLAEVLGTTPFEVLQTARRLGLSSPRPLGKALESRACLTVIRRNWHLLPYDQLLQLLGWSAEAMAYTLREDDFFFEKLGRLKPKAEPLRWSVPTEEIRRREREIAAVLKVNFPDGRLDSEDPLFSFVARLSQPPSGARTKQPSSAGDRSLRMGYSYFALYGDPLIDSELDPYPDGYLARLAESGVNAVWLHSVLARLTPLSWSPDASIERRRETLRHLVARASTHGIRVFLYLNEPRALGVSSVVFSRFPEWEGVREGEFVAVCTSVETVRQELRKGIAGLCEAVPDLGGFFSISGSENLTHCWSHGQGAQCPRCSRRRPAEVVAEVNAAFQAGVKDAGGRQRLIVWDWGWPDAWATEVIERLPAGVELMSVSEWALPIERGGVKSEIGEYCLSAVGPGPRAQRHWAAARRRGLSVVAKMQVGTTWEMAAVPYLPAVENVCRHVAGVKALGVESIMLGWTLGGHPSPNIDAVAEILGGGTLESLARRRHGDAIAAEVVTFWRSVSRAFSEFPYHGGTVYSAPLQVGPANPLWARPTGYAASMVGIPYDDLTSWRSVYPPTVFATQLERVATGMEAAVRALRVAVPHPTTLLAEELRFAETAAVHFASVANQTRFLLAREKGDAGEMRQWITADSKLAVRLHALQSRDSRIGFEASNQYFYVPLDLAEKVINCQWLEDTLPQV